jgi:hypothetical protein
VSPFDFILALVSFVYALAIAHLLRGAARMIRHRRDLIFSWPHGLWMAFTFLGLLAAWLTLWDFHAMKAINLATFAGAVVVCVGLYLTAALVTPEFDDPEDYNLIRFHGRQRATYLSVNLALCAVALGLNIAAGAEGVANWLKESGPSLALAAPIAAALLIRNRLVQIAAPAVAIGMVLAFVWIFYPSIG